jgi:hypothetical protein
MLKGPQRVWGRRGVPAGQRGWGSQGLVMLGTERAAAFVGLLWGGELSGGRAGTPRPPRPLC